ncbi:SusD/RagB family nutrient-binding outer membrane lipoprotein [Tenacibaculum pacificus]|uniref:SusD/RagB family nutrient-binding outer membrane lipoprotein n=1 Tax=Tenacibaculum pacificus TaxID=3018314 RepID=UPI0022F3EF1D|nr:SusD/RagB family nutrient-binding outer membrane lipoprotein [Tenacibaculum pacificus]WBX73069.1 SusD/RagB family nutrient-binding outer membrane lipoprotein [Tenacibaculum pacificus]
MKKFFKIGFIITTTIISFTSCNDVDFGDINNDPTKATIASTAALLTEAEKYFGTYATDTAPNLYVQYLANGDYNDQSRYLGLNFSYNDEYADVLVNLNKIIELCNDPLTKVDAATNGSLNNQKAVSKIMRAFMYWSMTDRWGMLPYTESLKETENKFPKYDTQEDIYKGCFAEIDDALAIIDSGNAPKGDILLGGSMDRWKKFANTLRVVMALRISKQVSSPTGYAAVEFNKGITGAITSNADNIYYTFLSDDSNDNPWQDRFESRKDYVLANTFVNSLIGSGTSTTPEDPRLEKYGEKSSNTLVYAGGIYGAKNNTADFSFITSNIINESTAPAMLFVYSQIEFAKAEAVLLGWYTGNTSTFYNKAIQASMDQWDVNITDAATYISNHPYTSLNDIANQKQVALFMQGYEAWAEWRRYKALGVAPALTIISNPINGTGIPQRHAYPGSAPTLNLDEYNNAVSIQGADDLDTVLWWAK